MSNLEEAAQAVLDRWDSPAWEWMPHGPTAALMADLRRALAAHREQQAEPVVEPEHWVITAKVGDIVSFRAPDLQKGDKVYPHPPVAGEVERLMTVLEIQDATIKALSARGQQAEPVVDGGNPSF